LSSDSDPFSDSSSSFSSLSFSSSSSESDPLSSSSSTSSSSSSFSTSAIRPFEMNSNEITEISFELKNKNFGVTNEIKHDPVVKKHRVDHGIYTGNLQNNI